MAIIVSKNNKNAEKLDPKEFGLESSIQEYVLENPNIIPLYDISEDTRLFVAAREFRTTSGPIDALGFDEAGNIYVIETKLFRNPDKRTVVAQALDYGASLWKNTTNADEFISALDSYTQKTFQESFADKYAEFFGLDNATTNIEAIIANLNEGNIKFVVLMDKLHDALKNLILYVNQNSKFDIYAVELEYYKHAEFEIMIPKLFGDEVKKDVVTKSKSSSEPWEVATNAEFNEDIRIRFNKDEFSQTANEAIFELREIYTAIAEKVGGRVQYYYRPSAKDIRFLVLDAEDKVLLILDSTCRVEGWPGKRTGKGVNFVNALELNIIAQGLFGRTEKSKSSWGINFKKDRASDDDIASFMKINRQEFAKL